MPPGRTWTLEPRPAVARHGSPSDLWLVGPPAAPEKPLPLSGAPSKPGRSQPGGPGPRPGRLGGDRAHSPARSWGARRVSRSWPRASQFGPHRALWPPSGSRALCGQSWVVALHWRRLLPRKMLAVALHPQQVRLTLSGDQICPGGLGGKAATSEFEAAQPRAALVPELCPGARGSGCRPVCVSWGLGGRLGAGPEAAAAALSWSAGARPLPVLSGSEGPQGPRQAAAEHPSAQKRRPAVRTRHASTLPARARVQPLVEGPRSCELHAAPSPRGRKERQRAALAPAAWPRRESMVVLTAFSG